MSLKCFYWNLSIGQTLAFASDVTDARRQIMATLSKNDAARPELEEALRSEPTILGAERKAVVAWNL